MRLVLLLHRSIGLLAVHAGARVDIVVYVSYITFITYIRHTTYDIVTYWQFSL